MKSAATFFTRWRGADVELRELTSSMKTLDVLLRSAGTSGNLLISCLDPRVIRSPVRWRNAKLELSRVTLPDSNEEGYLLSDQEADVQILCLEIEVRENVKLR